MIPRHIIMRVGQPLETSMTESMSHLGRVNSRRKGTHGEVYLKDCLLQVIDDLDAIVMRNGEPLEASITEGMSHPNIVNTIAHTVTHNSLRRCASHR